MKPAPGRPLRLGHPVLFLLTSVFAGEETEYVSITRRTGSGEWSVAELCWSDVDVERRLKPLRSDGSVCFQTQTNGSQLTTYRKDRQEGDKSQCTVPTLGCFLHPLRSPSWPRLSREGQSALPDSWIRGTGCRHAPRARAITHALLLFFKFLGPSFLVGHSRIRKFRPSPSLVARPEPTRCGTDFRVQGQQFSGRAPESASEASKIGWYPWRPGGAADPSPAADPAARPQ